MLVGLAAAPPQQVAAKSTPSHVDIVLHQLQFVDNLPASEPNNGKDQPSFSGQSSQTLNGVTFTAYDITQDFWHYLDTHEVSVEKAQDHFAQAAYAPTEPIASQVTTGEGEARFNGLSLRNNGRYAVYLFKETGHPAGSQGQSQNLVVVLPMRDDSGMASRIDLFPKRVIPGGKTMIKKQINADRTSFAYGQKIPYKLSVKVPADIATMKDFSISDNADSALSRVGAVNVKLDGTDVTDDNDLYQLTTVTEHSFVANFKVGSLRKYANKTITITYQMTIRPGTAADKPLINDAAVYPGGGQPQHDHAVVVTGGKRFVKVDATHDSVKLAGATFVVKNAAGAYLVKTADGWHWQQVAGDVAKTYQDEALYTLTSGKDGAFGIEGLGYGTYALYEVQAPAGFLRNEKPIPFTVVAGEYSRGETDPYAVVNVPQSPKPGEPVTPGQPNEPGEPNPRVPLPNTNGPGQPNQPGASRPRIPLPNTGMFGHSLKRRRISLRQLLPKTGEQWTAWLSTLGLILVALIVAIRVKTKKHRGI